jgi:hypothetical protein
LTSYYSDDELRAMVEEADKKDKDGRFERLKFFMSIAGKDYAPFPPRTLYFYEEAKWNWYTAGYVSAIAMARFAFESLLQDHYDYINDGSLPSSSTRTREATFDELVEEGESEGYLTPLQAKSIRRLEELFSRYFYPENSSTELKQLAKLKNPDTKLNADFIDKNLEEEAREAMHIMTEMLPDICQNSGGF